LEKLQFWNEEIDPNTKFLSANGYFLQLTSYFKIAQVLSKADALVIIVSA
jgi:hypothetical protein